MYGELANHVDKRVAKVERGLRADDERISNVEGKQGLLEKRQDEQARLIEEFSSQLLAARRQTIERKQLEDDRFDRPPSVEVLFVTAKIFLSGDAVIAALSLSLTNDDSLESEQWSIGCANPTGKRFILKFHFSPLQNARIADAVASSLKKDDVTWRHFHAVVADESKVPLLIFRDESTEERTQRIMGTVAKKALVVCFPDIANVFTFKSRTLDTTVFKFGKDKAEALCIMQPTGSTIEREAFQWNYELLESLQVDKSSLPDKIMELAARPEDAIRFRV